MWKIERSKPGVCGAVSNVNTRGTQEACLLGGYIARATTVEVELALRRETRTRLVLLIEKPSIRRTYGGVTT